MSRILLAIFCSLTSLVWSADKNSVASDYISTLQRLQQLAHDNRENDSQLKLRASIDALIPPALGSDQLYRLGISTYLVAYPQEAGADMRFDAVFAYASRRCAELLAERSDDHSAHLLRSMKPICGSDGGESLTYRDLMARQEQLKKNAKTK